MFNMVTFGTPRAGIANDVGRRADTLRLGGRCGTCVVTCMLWLSAGCSFAFVTPPPSKQASTDFSAAPEQRKECTKSNVAPVLDSIATGLQVARTVFAIVADNSVYSDPDQPLSREADVALGVTFTTVHLLSAVYGFSNTSECRRRSSGIGVDAYSPPPDWMMRKSETREADGNATHENIETAPVPTTAPAAVVPLEEPAQP